MADPITPLVAQCLEVLGVSESPDTYAALLRSSISSNPISQHGASLTLQKVLERAPSAEARERFVASYETLRGQDVRELDRFTLFLKLVGEEPSIASMLRKAGQGGHAAPRSAAALAAPLSASSAGTSMLASGANWQLTRPYLCGAYLQLDALEGHAVDVPAANAAAMLAALPIPQQEEMLVADVLHVLCGVEGNFLRARLPASGGAPRLAALISGTLAAITPTLTLDPDPNPGPNPNHDANRDPDPDPERNQARCRARASACPARRRGATRRRPSRTPRCSLL